MKLQFLTFGFLLLCLSSISQDFQTVFLEDSNYISRATAMKDGNYLVASNELFANTQISFVSIYNIAGENLLRKQVDIIADRLVYSVEVENGDFIHVFERGGIYRSDANAENFTFLDAIATPTTGAVFLRNLIQHEQVLHITGVSSSDGTQRSLRFEFDLADLTKPLKRYESPIPFLRSLAFLSDGSHLECSIAGEVAMLDNRNNLRWRSSFTDVGFAEIRVNQQGEIYAIGTDRNEGGLIVKLDALGNTLWSVILPYTDCPISSCQSIVWRLEFFENGELLVVGEDRYETQHWLDSNTTIVKLDSNGNIQWKKIADFSDTWEFPVELLKLEQNRFLVIGNTNQLTYNTNTWLGFFLSIDELTDTKNIFQTSQKLKVYPNPTQDFIQLENQAFSADTHIEIFDMMGRLLKQTNYSSPISITDLAKGNYVLKVYSDGNLSSILWSKI